jgi:hypothetical protein
MKDTGGSSESLAGQIVTELTGSAQSNGVTFCSILNEAYIRFTELVMAIEANPSHDQKATAWLYERYHDGFIEYVS